MAMKPEDIRSHEVSEEALTALELRYRRLFETANDENH